MNTRTIETTKTLRYPNFPVISSHKQNKTISKHFTNLSIYLPQKEFALLNWLIYESDREFRFRYSTHLLRKFSAHIKAINIEYKGGEPTIPTAIQLIRKDFKSLVENGYIIKSADYYVLNPMLTKHSRQTAIDYQNKVATI